jgi:Family of unknown function (DUF6623)
MALKAAIWVHGTAVEVEYPDRIAPLSTDRMYERGQRKGWGTHFYGLENTTNWFHFAIPTPGILDDARPPLEKVFVFYWADGWAKITNVHLYDGPARIKSFDGLNLSGNHSGSVDSFNTWTVSPPVVLAYGLGISVGVEFGPIDQVGIPFPGILFTTVGADFRRP